MRPVLINHNNRINNNLHYLEMYFSYHNHDSVVQMPKKTMKTLFYNIKPNNRNNLKQLNFYSLNMPKPKTTLPINKQIKKKRRFVL